MARLAIAGVIVAATLTVSPAWGHFAVESGTRPFNIRYEATFRGDIALIGNSLLACLPGSLADVNSNTCENAQAGVGGTGIDNNNFDMRYLDIDGDATTFNSSSANLTMPAGAQITFAALYWGAFSDAGNVTPNPSRANVKLRAPGSSAYVPLIASQLDDVYINGQGNAYQGFVDITSQVRAAGAGTYTIADVLAVQGKNRYAGWAIVFAYTSPTDNLRNLVVYDGFKYDPDYAPFAIPLSGFLTPASGPVTVTLGIYGSDGDLGNPGDQLLLNTTLISDSANPSNNVFNSSISLRGANVTTRNPAFVNNMNVDVDLFDASNIIANGSTTATLTVSATQEKFLPALVTFSALVFQPAVQIDARVNDLNGGDVRAGDTLEYTIVMTNAGVEAANNTRLNVTLSAGASFVPGSINLVNNAGGASGAQTDAAGDDLAEVSGSQLNARIGSGSNASAGGTMAVNSVATVVYRIKVNDQINNLLVLDNRAEVSAISTSNPSVVLTATNTLQVIAYPYSRILLPLVVKQ